MGCSVVLLVKVLNSGELLNSTSFIELTIESMLCRYPSFHEGNGLVVAGLNASPLVSIRIGFEIYPLTQVEYIFGNLSFIISNFTFVHYA
jgi:maltodextrin utilization protein YvdJ